MPPSSLVLLQKKKITYFLLLLFSIGSFSIINLKSKSLSSTNHQSQKNHQQFFFRQHIYSSISILTPKSFYDSHQSTLPSWAAVPPCIDCLSLADRWQPSYLFFFLHCLSVYITHFILYQQGKKKYRPKRLFIPCPCGRS